MCFIIRIALLPLLSPDHEIKQRSTLDPCRSSSGKREPWFCNVFPQRHRPATAASVAKSSARADSEPPSAAEELTKLQSYRSIDTAIHTRSQRCCLVATRRCNSPLCVDARTIFRSHVTRPKHEIPASIPSHNTATHVPSSDTPVSIT